MRCILLVTAVGLTCAACHSSDDRSAAAPTANLTSQATASEQGQGTVAGSNAGVVPQDPGGRTVDGHRGDPPGTVLTDHGSMRPAESSGALPTDQKSMDLSAQQAASRSLHVGTDGGGTGGILQPDGPQPVLPGVDPARDPQPARDSAPASR